MKELGIHGYIAYSDYATAQNIFENNSTLMLIGLSLKPPFIHRGVMDVKINLVEFEYIESTNPDHPWGDIYKIVTHKVLRTLKAWYDIKRFRMKGIWK
jgi:hypothetical protein